MAIVGDYTAQQMRNLILKFYPGSYTPQTFGNVVLNWQTRASYSSSGNLSAVISAMGLYQDTTYTYLKYCEEYVVGYGQYGVQILKGRCYYGGIRDLAASYIMWAKPVYSDTSDLPAQIGRVFIEDFPASINVETPADLLAYIKVLTRLEKDLPALIHGLDERFLPAQINAMITSSLPATVSPVPPVDLPAYIKTWPMEHLPASIYGWDELDLPAYLYAIQKGDLPAAINVVPPKDLGMILRGWVREATADLGAYIFGFAYEDLPAIIRATYLKDLPGYWYAVQPQDLPAYIRGWAEGNLTASLIGVYGAYDLRATITATENYKDLIARIKAVIATEVPRNLPASIIGWYAYNLGAYIKPTMSVDLSAYISSTGQISDLTATIISKTIRLTSVLDVITMSHLDLSAVINPSCIYTSFKNLSSYIRCIYKSDLWATILGKKYDTTSVNLIAKVGYADTYSYIDKLPLSIIISADSYRYIDKLPLIVKIFNGMRSLTASIIGTMMYSDLPVSITGDYLQPHDFENTKNKDRVYTRTYAGFFESLKLVEISFKSIVKDYFYSEAGATAWKVYRPDKWIVNIESYIPQNLSINVKRKLFRFKHLNDISIYGSIDEAVRDAIDYVTGEIYSDISARVNSHGGFLNLFARVSGRGTTSTNEDLQASITGDSTGKVIVGKEPGGVEIF